ncbi:MAG: tautomerase family protein [Fusobacteriaceae bacterium]
MPHITVTNIKGHSEEEKKLLAKEITEACVRAYKMIPEKVSVSFEDDVTKEGFIAILKSLDPKKVYKKFTFVPSSEDMKK